jgi:hypothetical protein
MSVADAAESGTRLDELLAMRRVIARRIDDEKTAARDLASLSIRQMSIGREIEALLVEEADEVREAAKSNVVTDKKWRPEAI